MATEEEPSTSAYALRKSTGGERAAATNTVGQSDSTCEKVLSEVSSSPACKDVKKASSSSFLKGIDFKCESSTNTEEYRKKNGKSQEHNDNQVEDKIDESDFQCNICFDKAQNPVVSMCGHLFCWSCLNQWMQVRPNRKLCPVCRGGVDIEKVVPVYCHNSGPRADPRPKEEPRRPVGQREEPPVQPDFLGFRLDENVNMVFGIGAFPFAFFGASFNVGGPRLPAFLAEQTLPNFFLYMAFVFLAWIVLA